jgi:hypothetical protein
VGHRLRIGGDPSQLKDFYKAIKVKGGYIDVLDLEEDVGGRVGLCFGDLFSWPAVTSAIHLS